MARTKDFEPLVQALAQLDPSDRARVVADAVQHGQPERRPSALSIPLLKGGTEWMGGDLRREDLYSDDGR